MNFKLNIFVVVALLAIFSFSNTVTILGAAVSTNHKKLPRSGKMNDEVYVSIYSRMIHYDRVYRKKYKIINTNPETNRTAEGIANAYKYSDALKKQRKALLDEYGITAEDLENYNAMLDKNSSSPEGAKHRQVLLDRCAEKAKKLDMK